MWLEELYRNERLVFDDHRKLICDSLIRELRNSSNMDSLFNAIIASQRLEKNLHYRLLIDNISVTFDGKNYIQFYENSSPLKENDALGITISGDLKKT